MEKNEQVSLKLKAINCVYGCGKSKYLIFMIIYKKMNQQGKEQIEIQELEDDSKFDGQIERLPQILQESKRFTLAFIEQLKEKALTPISQEVLDHYHGEIRSNYSVKDIMNIIDKRISKMIRNKKIKKNWNFDDIVLLLWFVSKYLALKEDLTCEKYTNEDWKFISKLIPGSSPRGCMFKFISLKKVKLSSHNWSEREEDILRVLVKQLGQNNWKDIAEYLYQNNPSQKIFRTPKQCREHWNCYLDPRLKKGPWSQVQDLKLLKNVKQNKGQRKWSTIKHLFEGRTQNALKNRYNLLLQRQKKLRPEMNESELIIEYLKMKGLGLMVTDVPVTCINQEQQQVEGPQLPQEIYEQVMQEGDDRIMSVMERGDNDKIQRRGCDRENLKEERLIQSEKSSFRLSGAYQRQKCQEEGKVVNYDEANEQYHSYQYNPGHNHQQQHQEHNNHQKQYNHQQQQEQQPHGSNPNPNPNPKDNNNCNNRNPNANNNTNLCPHNNNCSSRYNNNNSILFVSMGGLPSIITNGQGFYTNFVCKPFYT